MAFCPSCGQKNDNYAKFCSGCGQSSSNNSSFINPSVKKTTEHQSQNNPNPKAEKSNKFNDGFYSSIFHTLFVENDVNELWNVFLWLFIFDICLALFMSHLDVYGHGVESDFIFYLGFYVVLGSILLACVKRGINKNNELWVLGVIIFSVSFAVWAYSSDESQFFNDFQAAFNFFTKGGSSITLGKIGFIFLIIWDMLLGTVFEFLLLFRIYSAIKFLKI